MKRFRRSELRGGLTLHTWLWRWAYVHHIGDRDLGLATGDFVTVGGWPYVVTGLHRIRYHDGRAVTVIALMRFRWTEALLLALPLLALIALLIVGR